MRPKSKASDRRRQRSQERKRVKRRDKAKLTRRLRQEHEQEIGRASKQIADRLFLDVLQSDGVREAIEAALPSESRDRVYTPWVTLAMFLRQVLNQSSLGTAITEAVASGLIDDSVSRRTTSYSNARKRVPHKLFRTLARIIASQLSQCTPEQWKWRGRDVKLVDGSTILFEDTPENQGEFPQNCQQKKGAGFPTARIVAVLALSTAAVLGIAMGPVEGKETGEHALLRQLLGSFSRGDVMVGDSYYASYFLIATLQRMGVDFVFQQHGARDTDFRTGKSLGQRDHLATWPRPARPEWMTEREYARLPKELTVREVRVRKKVLVTSFLDPRKVPKEEVGKLFELRWNIELDLRNIKTTLGVEKLSCRTPDMCKKELAAYMLAYNLIRLLMAEAAEKAGVLPRQLSFQHTVTSWLAWSLLGKLQTEEDITSLITWIAKVRVGNRPGRVEPRLAKARGKPWAKLNEPRAVARRRIQRRGHPKEVAAA
jgi:hypothetical protein